MACQSGPVPARLRTVSGGNDPTVAVDIVAIPGVGTKSVDEWPICSTKWKELFTSREPPSSRLLAFDYDLALDETFSWKLLLQLGSKLLNALLDVRRGAEFRTRPTLFICHGLGGLILKQALSVANQQLYRFHHVFACLAGVMFLGTPHSLPNNTALCERSLQLLRACTKFGPKKANFSLAEESQILAGLAIRFEDVQLRIPILSVYETKELRIRTGTFRTQKLILIDRSIATTNAPLEELLPAPYDHGDLCMLQTVDGAVIEPVAAFVEKAITDAQVVIPQRFQSLDVESAMGESLGRSAGSVWGVVRESKGSTEDPDTGAATGVTGVTGASMVMVPMVSEFAPPSRHARLPCYMIEPRVRNSAFFGRSDILKELDEALLPTEEKLISSEVVALGLKQFVVCGLGGVGKTEVALEFAYSRKSRFDAIFLVAADEPSKLASGFCQIALSLGLEESSQRQSEVVSRELVKGWLTNPTKAPERTNLDASRQDDANWLLIFDNVDDASILDDYWPVGGSGSLLITSRNPLASAAHSTKAPSIDLEPFSTTEGALFLRQLTNITDTEEELQSERIAECLGGLPLAITQMAGIIRWQDLSYSEFLERYEDESELAELHNLSIGQQSQHYDQTIASVWAFDALGEEAQMLLKITSLLDADRIQEHIFLAGAPNIDARQYPSKQSSLAAARAELFHASFIRRNPQKREFWVHRLVQDSMRAKMSLEETQRIIDITITLILSVWPSWDVANKHNLTRWNKCEEYWPHVLALSKAYGKLFRKGWIKPDIRFATLLNDAGWWQHERGNSHDGKRILELALEICDKSDPGKPTALVGDLYHSLGAMANGTNDRVASLKNNTRLFEIRQAVYAQEGIKDYRYASGYAQLAISLAMHNELDRAIKAFDDSMQAFSQTSNFNKDMLSVPLADIGFALWLNGDLEKAAERLEGGIRDREELYGKNDRVSFKLGFLLHALGNVRAAQGRWEESFEHHQNSLIHYKATIGNNHHRTADLCHKVAQHYIRLKLYEPAKNLLDQALKVWGGDRAVYKPEIARTTFLKSKLAQLQGDTVEAANLFSQALQLRNEIPWAQAKDADELQESDFDSLVAFWSR